ncbi:hypothetical protein [Phytohabitans houttuyneae]|uniref:Allene oxide cyclase barrel-like domain-containing protein n=1 Tax=Phytohabitans houttuyneae TaxID=1076126 RepID=A0A6V8KYM5_9ACTN|nr:hypothetical protein [Phytohabitans houttuyneae]GFJ85625.1 hypothetical protein Phou_098050 [Phytohabitans houttuyneae]
MYTRRNHLAGLGLGLVAGALAAPSPARARSAVELVAKRKKITLPDLPTPGLTYIATFDLTDPAGAGAGVAAASTSIVDVTLEGPVILSQVVLQLADGEIHYQRLLNRFGAYPRASVGAILGGTGAYAIARGDVQVTWPDQDTIKLALNLVEPST